MKNLALFDFDGTITFKDSFIDFLFFAVGKPRTYAVMLMHAHLLLLMKLKLMNNERVKQIVFASFFNGYNADELYTIGKNYSLKLDKIIRESARKKICQHMQNGDRVVIVSASLDIWLRDWCKNNNLELICTMPEIVDGKITGQLSTPNCYGAEKVNRIKEIIDINKYEAIYAYGDSRGDKEMLELSDNPNFRVF